VVGALGIEGRKGRQTAQSLPKAIIQTRIANVFREGDCNTILSLLRAEPNE
jgi:hypothetical protein